MTKLIFFTLFLFFICISFSSSKKTEDSEKPKWAKKDVRDYNDADLERLFDQWEEDEEPLPSDELPEHLRPSPAVDFSSVDVSNPENLLKLTKKGKTLMVFVQVSGNPTKHEADEITKLWQSALWNNHIQAERFMVSDNRSIFMFKDGSQAWDAKDFLLEQDQCESVTIENKVYPGKGNTEKQTMGPKTKDESKKKDEMKKKKKTPEKEL